MKKIIENKKQVYVHIFRYILVLACFSPLQSWAQTVTLKLKNQPIKKAFEEVTKQTGYYFFYDETLLTKAKPVTADYKNAALKSVLDAVFANQPFTYAIESKMIIITLTAPKKNAPDSAATGSPEAFTVTGRILNRTGQPLAGATISLKGKNFAGSSGEDGKYSIPAGANDQLVVSYVNHKPEIISIKGRKVIDVVLEANVNAMNEVIISTGYQKIEQKYLTGSVTRLRMDSIYQPGLSTVDKMLEGRVPGLIMIQNSGQAGAAPKLRIRGTSTILGTREPLWVVDGIVLTDPVPIDANRVNDLDFVNLVGNAISGLNPNDIESIDVLKDAAATALYGVRAANGVIVITTKRGTPGPPAINYSSSINYTRRPRYTDNDVYMMNSLERIDVSREMFSKQIPVKGAPEAYEKAVIEFYTGIIDYDTYKKRVSRAEQMNTDWLGTVTQDVVSTNHSLGISGGSQLSRYYASVGYTNERGVIKGEYSKRYTGQVKFDVNYRKLKAQFNIMANKNDRLYTPSDIGILNYAYGTSRAIPLYNEDGSLYFFATSNNNRELAPRSSFNVLNEMNHSGQAINGNSYTAIANLNYELIQGLQLETTLSYSASSTEQSTWYAENTNTMDIKRGLWPDIPSENPFPFGGLLQRQYNRQNSYTIRGQGNYSRFVDEGKKHLLNATIGGELSSTKNSGIAHSHGGYYPDRGHTFAVINAAVYTAYANFLTNNQPVITEGLSNLASAYLTGSYIYDDRYVLSAYTRSDFSNAFGSRSNERFLPTWGLSGRWNIDRDLFKNARWVNQAALRLSFGTQGTMLPGQTPYTIIEKKQFDTRYQSFVATIVNFPNPNLQWEKTNAYNASIDFSLFNSRLNGSIGFFYKNTTNTFLSKSISEVNGRSYYIVNGGNLENKGVELLFNFTPINESLGSKNKKLIWRIDPQLGQVFNRLLNQSINKGREGSLIDAAALANYENYLSGQVVLNGKSVNTFYAYRFKGLDRNGQPVFYGAESEDAAVLTERYRKMGYEEILNTVLVEAGRREPVLQGGIMNYIAYGSWSLDFNFAYSFGNKIRLLQIASGNYGTYQPSSQQNLRKEFVNRWRYPGDEQKTTIPGLYPQNNTAPWWIDGSFPSFAKDYYQMYDNADIRVVSGNYIKLQSANLNYTCPPELCKRMHFKAARISLSGSNLFTWANKDLRGQDPSQSGTSPNINLGLRPVYALSINVSF
jgi:TonB-linked SusC/RagA family outer membrane protein